MHKTCPKCNGEGGWLEYGSKYKRKTSKSKWVTCEECSGKGWNVPTS